MYKSYKSSGEKNHVLANENIRKKCIERFDSSVHSISNSLEKYVNDCLKKISKFIEQEHFNSFGIHYPDPFDTSILDEIDPKKKDSLYHVLYKALDEVDVKNLKNCILEFPRGKKSRLKILESLKESSKLSKDYLERSYLKIFNRLGPRGMHDFMANVNKKRDDDLRTLDLKKLTFAEAKNIDEVYEEIQADLKFFKELIIKHVLKFPELYYFLSIKIDIFLDDHYQLGPVFK
jgi:hypothetical protein